MAAVARVVWESLRDGKLDSVFLLRRGSLGMGWDGASDSGARGPDSLCPHVIVHNHGRPHACTTMRMYY